MRWVIVGGDDVKDESLTVTPHEQMQSLRKGSIAGGRVYPWLQVVL